MNPTAEGGRILVEEQHHDLSDNHRPLKKMKNIPHDEHQSISSSSSTSHHTHKPLISPPQPPRFRFPFALHHTIPQPLFHHQKHLETATQEEAKPKQRTSGNIIESNDDVEDRKCSGISTHEQPKTIDDDYVNHDQSVEPEWAGDGLQSDWLPGSNINTFWDHNISTTTDTFLQQSDFAISSFPDGNLPHLSTTEAGILQQEPYLN
nr:ethylene-responsive transcription factor RAP2-13-like [Ipomoea batatas]